MKALSPVLVSLQNPREKVWGVLLSIQASGITVRGIDLNSFDDWSRGVARGDEAIQLSAIFFPIHRVERIDKDETVGEVPSLADTFSQRVGQDILTFLGLDAGRPTEAAEDVARWMTLAQAEQDYVRRVLEDCEWDREEAARILGLTTEALSERIDRNLE